MNLKQSLIYAMIPALLLYFCTLVFIPFVHQHFNLPLIYAWYLGSSLLLFIPMFIVSIFKIKKEGQRFSQRARFHRISLKTLLLSFSGIILIAVLTQGLMVLMKKINPMFSPQPDFMHLEAINGNYQILLFWLPMFFFNIFGEALYWRSWMLPLQEHHFKRKAWIINSFCWAIFHLAFGWNLMIILLPILIITPFIVQKTQNTWSDIIIHAGINGTGFLLIAFGIL